MRVTAFNGSPRKEGNTSILLKYVLKELEAEGITTELVQIGGKHIKGCVACYRCKENMDRKCAVKDDMINDCIDKMLDSDGIILGSPTYVTDVSPEIKALIDRATVVSRANEYMFKKKVGAAVVAVRRAGSIHAFDTMNHFFLISQMIVPGSCYWNMAIGLQPGDVAQDEEGINTMKILGRNMAWLMKKTAD